MDYVNIVILIFENSSMASKLKNIKNNWTRSIQWQSQEFIFGGAKHKFRQLIISMYIFIISILTVIYIQFNNKNPKVYYF